ncbi:YcnI family copper-binding membrane protein [Lentzea sp. HUAS TT2]|uniref:YcnI family copper-binding membrane protein n=1 Tax=Lentzea sp. HUAS TT2 TaxID=3447454 RepID=UPI003F72E3B8
MSPKYSRVFASAAVIACAATLFTSGVASAHLEPVPGQAVKGKSATITFKVPNERPDSGTVSVRLDLPAEFPLRTVRVRSTTGWTADAVKAKLDQPVKTGNSEITEAFRSITWTATPGTRIAPNEFAEFAVTLGTMPDNTDKLVINAVQTYESGEVVNWNQPPPAQGQGEPDHPAPVLKLVANDAEAAADSSGEHSNSVPAATAAPSSSGTWLGGSALGVAALALGIAIGTAVRSRRTPQTGDSK